MLNLSKKLPAINAGSMADIAFLLLVFFLVTTTIQQDMGLRTSLPQMSNEPSPIKARNLFQVVLTPSGDLYANEQKIELSQLSAQGMAFIKNKGQDANLSESPKRAFILLSFNSSVSYDSYLRSYNELQAAYHRIWEDESERRYQKNWERLQEVEQRLIKKDYPVEILEQEVN